MARLKLGRAKYYPPGKVSSLPGRRSPPNRAAYVKQVSAWARKRGWPILADVLSPLRHARELSSQIVSHYDLILRSSKHLAESAPRSGHSARAAADELKSCAAGWGQLHAPLLIVHDGPENVDPLHRPAHYWRTTGFATWSALDPKAPIRRQNLIWPAGRQLETKAAEVCCETTGLTADWLFEGRAGVDAVAQIAGRYAGFRRQLHAGA